jgi:hypothetical protein
MRYDLLLFAVRMSQVTRYTMLALALSLMEAVSEQNDNLILPIWGWCLGVCMGL